MKRLGFLICVVMAAGLLAGCTPSPPSARETVTAEQFCKSRGGIEWIHGHTDFAGDLWFNLKCKNGTVAEL